MGLVGRWEKGGCASHSETTIQRQQMVSQRWQAGERVCECVRTHCLLSRQSQSSSKCGHRGSLALSASHFPVQG